MTTADEQTTNPEKTEAPATGFFAKIKEKIQKYKEKKEKEKLEREPPLEKGVRCPNCGKINDPERKHCDECDVDLKTKY
ncbi:hypothetical protein ACFL0W_06020 [Nanoarchaeota archaeon]